MNLSYKNVRTLQKAFYDITEHFGTSTFHMGLPELVIYYDEDRQVYGEWDSEELVISVNLAVVDTIKIGIATILHEYCHYLQSPSWHTRYSKHYSYDENPYEVQADKFAEQYLPIFYPMKK